jgi:hypothetical protein
LGYAVISYQVPDTDASHPYLTITNDRFKDIDGVTFPGHSHVSCLDWTGGRRTETFKAEIMFDKIKLSDEAWASPRTVGAPRQSI